MSEAKFIDGLVVKAPGDRAPEYVKAKLWIKRQELIAWLQAQTGEWINADVKVSQGGKWYAAVDDWKPEGTSSSGSRGGAPQRERPATPTKAKEVHDYADDDIPFVTNRSTF